MTSMRRVSAVAVLAGVVLFLAAPGAGAHALVKSSSPPDGAILDKAPTQVTITFTERPDPSLSIIHVLDASGREVQRGAAAPAPGQPLQLRIALESVGKGVYTVTWRAVSKVDGHVTAGSFSFGVGVSPAGATPPAGVVSAGGTPSPSPLAAVGRWALYAGLALMVGGGGTELYAFRRKVPPARWVIASWGLAAVGLGVVIVAERSTVGVGYGQLLRSGTGHTLVWQGIGVALTGVAVGWLVHRRTATALAAVAVSAAGTMLLHAMAGHAAASGRFAWFDVLVQWFHLMAVGVWVGGLVWLLVETRSGEGSARADGVKRFSTMAGIALAVVAVTGVQRAISEVGGPTAWSRLFHTSFGITLLVKVGLFAGLVTLGARNRYVNVPGAARSASRFSSLRRTVGAEMLIAAGVLGVTAVLTQLPPAATVAETRPPAVLRVVATGSDFATTVRVRLTVSPGTVGPNEFEASVVDYDTGAPVTATGVQLGFSLPGRPELGTPTLDLHQHMAGVWMGQGTVLSMDGRWNVTVLVQETASAVTVPLQVQTRLPPQQVQVLPGKNGQPTIYTITLSGGASVQTYVDPGIAGKNVVHFTFFRASGDEQPIASASALATPPSGATADLLLIRFDAGHFVANTTLTSGRWRFQIAATTPDGTTYSAYFEPSIP
jgi:copper transport protein